MDFEPARVLKLYDWYAARAPRTEPLKRLRLSVALALNQSFYEVSEAEARLFFELAQAEAEAPNPESLIREFLRLVTPVVRARRGHWKWLKGTRATSSTPQYVECGRSCSWVVPVLQGAGVPAQVIFDFKASYPWLPRELRLVQAAAERCLAAAERANLNAGLRAQQERIRALAARVLEVEDKERRRISRELHDETGQSMLLMRMQLEMLERELSGHPCTAQIRELRLNTERTIDEIRRVIAALSPATLERFGLLPAIRHLANRLAQSSGLRVQLSLPRRPPMLSSVCQIALYRIFQEACNNVLKHARANTVKIRLRSSDDFVELMLHDDGKGFHPDAAADKPEAFGLSGIRERAALVGGRVSVRSAPGRGASLYVKLPISEENTLVENPNFAS
jgi:signal transduction histidine kinase